MVQVEKCQSVGGGIIFMLVTVDASDSCDDKIP